MPVDATAIIGLLVGFLVVGVIGIYHSAFIHFNLHKNNHYDYLNQRMNTCEFKRWRPNDTGSEPVHKRNSLHFTAERHQHLPAWCNPL